MMEKDKLLSLSQVCSLLYEYAGHPCDRVSLWYQITKNHAVQYKKKGSRIFVARKDALVLAKRFYKNDGKFPMVGKRTGRPVGSKDSFARQKLRTKPEK